MSRSQQRKGADGEKELVEILNAYGYHVTWGGSQTYGTVPDVSGLHGIHIECKRVEKLNVPKAMEQSVIDSIKFQDGLPALFHRRNRQPWLVTMRLDDWMRLYKRSGL
jgi:Holliday junction resolvase